MNKTDKVKVMEAILSRINELSSQEAAILAKATKLGMKAAELRAAEQRMLYEAKKLEHERYSLAIEYNKTKSPCPNVLAMAERELGRKLTYDEVIEIERVYAEKAAKSNGSVAH